jgi:hypothetical protein
MDWHTNKLLEQFLVFIGKVVSIPALVAITVKIAIEVRKKTATKAGVITSLIVGLGTAYLMQDFINWLITNEGGRTVATGFVAIAGEKVMEWLIFKMEVGPWFKKVGQMSLEYIRKILGLKDE